ncbi:Lcl C-terminal domain-containing protein [Desulfocurvus sp. DL9XJH121]
MHDIPGPGERAFLPVLSTGQSACFDERGASLPCAGSGQDAEAAPGLAWPEPRFEARDGSVLDRLTGLVWSANPAPLEFPLTWAESLDGVDALNRAAHAGRTDWRMPGKLELHSLVSFATRKPALPPGHPFGSVFLGWYWTSTTFAGGEAHAWRVHMEGGRMFYGRKSEYSLLWPVAGESPVLAASGQTRTLDPLGRDAQRGRPLPEPRFTPLGDAVRDNLTGLVWLRRADLCGPVSWAGALARVRELDARDPQRSWSLPTIRELESLTDASRAFPALADGHPFTHPGEAYWSSTTSGFEHDWAMALYLHKGAVGVGFKTGEPFLAWPVSRDTAAEAD